MIIMAQTSNHPLSDQMRVPKTENLVDDTIEGTMNEAIHTSNIDGVNIDLEVNGKRDRPWDFPTEEGMDAKKKIKVNDETQMPQSPSRRHRDSLYNVSIVHDRHLLHNSWATEFSNIFAISF